MGSFTGRCAAGQAAGAYPNPRCAQVLILLAALSTCDPGNIMESMRLAKRQRVRVSLVGLAAEMHVCRVIAQVGSSACCFVVSIFHNNKTILTTR